MVPLPHRASQIRECPVHLSPVLPPHTPLTGCPSISASERPWAQSSPLLRDQRAKTQAHGVGQLLWVTLGGAARAQQVQGRRVRTATRGRKAGAQAGAEGPGVCTERPHTPPEGMLKNENMIPSCRT